MNRRTLSFILAKAALESCSLKVGWLCSRSHLEVGRKLGLLAPMASLVASATEDLHVSTVCHLQTTVDHWTTVDVGGGADNSGSLDPRAGALDRDLQLKLLVTANPNLFPFG